MTSLLPIVILILSSFNTKLQHTVHVPNYLITRSGINDVFDQINTRNFNIHLSHNKISRDYITLQS